MQRPPEPSFLPLNRFRHPAARRARAPFGFFRPEINPNRELTGPYFELLFEKKAQPEHSALPNHRGGENLMEFISGSVTTTAVATIYVIYRRYQEHLRKKDHTLRERVTYMLWCAAEQIGA
jgi:hypothetical protein